MRRALTALILLSLSTFAGLSLALSASATSPKSEEDELLRNATLVFTQRGDRAGGSHPGFGAHASVGHRDCPGRRTRRGSIPRQRGRERAGRVSGPLDASGDLRLRRRDSLSISMPSRLILCSSLNRAAGWTGSSGRVPTSVAARPMAAGSLGHDTLTRINADLVAYMRFEHYFAGVAVDDWIVQEMTASNAALYGRPYSTDEIVRGAGFFHAPQAARMWREALANYFREMS